MMNTPLVPSTAHPHRSLVIKLLVLVAIAFAFGFALVPLYDALCLATGLNGKTAGAADSTRTFGTGGIKPSASVPPSRIDLNRTVTVEFTGTVMPGLPWDMQSLTTNLDLHPGELHQAFFRVHNRSNKPLVGQAIPSVSPGTAAKYFQKLDCFCFAQQTLAPGETKELQVTFIVRPEIDKDIRTITLAYAFFNVAETKTAAGSVALR
jgi:cytochrome c oxidase assembly protein subunit 11